MFESYPPVKVIDQTAQTLESNSSVQVNIDNPAQKLESDPPVLVIDLTAQKLKSNPSIKVIDQTTQMLESNPPVQVFDQADLTVKH